MNFKKTNEFHGHSYIGVIDGCLHLQKAVQNGDIEEGIDKRNRKASKLENILRSFNIFQ